MSAFRLYGAHPGHFNGLVVIGAAAGAGVASLGGLGLIVYAATRPREHKRKVEHAVTEKHESNVVWRTITSIGVPYFDPSSGEFRVHAPFAHLAKYHWTPQIRRSAPTS